MYLVGSHIYLLTYSMQQISSWEAKPFWASQEIFRILWNPKVHHRIHKCPPPVPILSLLDPVHTPTFYSWRSILILSPHLCLGLKSVFSLRFPHQNPVYTSTLPHTCYMPRRTTERLVFKFFFGMARQSLVGQGRLIIRLHDYTQIHHSR